MSSKMKFPHRRKFIPEKSKQQAKEISLLVTHKKFTIGTNRTESEAQLSVFGTQIDAFSLSSLLSFFASF